MQVLINSHARQLYLSLSLLELVVELTPAPALVLVIFIELCRV